MTRPSEMYLFFCASYKLCVVDVISRWNSAWTDTRLLKEITFNYTDEIHWPVRLSLFSLSLFSSLRESITRSSGNHSCHELLLGCWSILALSRRTILPRQTFIYFVYLAFYRTFRWWNIARRYFPISNATILMSFRYFHKINRKSFFYFIDPSRYVTTSHLLPQHRVENLTSLSLNLFTPFQPISR